MTYARARLWIGISGVGLVVVLSALLLALEVPARWLAGRGGTVASDAPLLLGALLLGALVALPFDVLGGLVIPGRFGRPHPTPAAFALRWLRGVLVLLGVSSISGALLLVAGRAGGRPAALVAFVAIAALLVLVQEPLARAVGGLRRVPREELPRGLAGDDDLVVLAGEDPGFSGGFAAPRGALVVPSQWLRAFEPDALAVLLERRRCIVRAGAWRRGILLAIAWNALGFGLASLLPGAGVATPAELVATALGFTLWTFLGLLLLPTPSRWATRAADARVSTRPEVSESLAGAITRLDRLQDDEPERSPGVESVFHPVPSVATRLRSLGEARHAQGGAWNLARTALFLSNVGLSQLPRAVHCNSGRPELWVYLPTDG